MKNRIQLVRSYLDNCTIGKIFHDGKFICYTVEKPWKSNKPFESCIPAGVYSLLPHSSEDHKNAFKLKNHDLGVGINEGDSVRYGCLIHVANFPHEVVGCIGPGLYLHPSTWGVSQSRNAMNVLNNLVDFKLGEWEFVIV